MKTCRVKHGCLRGEFALSLKGNKNKSEKERR